MYARIWMLKFCNLTTNTYVYFSHFWRVRPAKRVFCTW